MMSTQHQLIHTLVHFLPHPLPKGECRGDQCIDIHETGSVIHDGSANGKRAIDDSRRGRGDAGFLQCNGNAPIQFIGVVAAKSEANDVERHVREALEVVVRAGVFEQARGAAARQPRPARRAWT